MGSSESSFEKRNDLPTVVIVGGGGSGIAAAQALDEKANVLVIDRKDYYFNNIAALRATTTPDWHKNICFGYDKALHHGYVVQAEVTEIDPEEKLVHVLGRDEGISFDYCVIATGSSYFFPAKIAEPKVSDVGKQYDEINSLIKDSKNILIIGGGPVGVELAGEICMEHPNGDKNIHLVHSHEALLDEGLTLKMRNKTLEQLEKYKVNVHFNTRLNLQECFPQLDSSTPVSYLVTKKDKTQKKKSKKGEKKSKKDDEVFTVDINGNKIEVDLVFFCTGAKTNTKSLDKFKDIMDESSHRVNTEPNLSLKGYPNIFAVGDIANVGPKMLYYGQLQAEIAAKNIKFMLKNKEPKAVWDPNPGRVMIVPIGAYGTFEIKGKVFGTRPVQMIKGKTLLTEKIAKSLNQKKTKVGEISVNVDSEYSEEDLKHLEQIIGDSNSARDLLGGDLPLSKNSKGEDFT